MSVYHYLNVCQCVCVCVCVIQYPVCSLNCVLCMSFSLSFVSLSVCVCVCVCVCVGRSCAVPYVAFDLTCNVSVLTHALFAGVVNFIPSSGPTFGDGITKSPHLAAINFTGSVE